MISKKIGIAIAILLLSFTAGAFMARTVYANPKSLYVIAAINSSPTPIKAYDVQAGGTLVYQATHNIPYRGIGAVGITIDAANKALFVTYEISNTLQLVNATTFVDLGFTTAPGASNLAGVVFDQGKQKVYTVDRNTNHLYVYSWNAVSKTLTLDSQVSLTGVTAAVGLALDEVNGLLYVGQLTASGNVRVFSTADWSVAASYTVSQSVQGIALDVQNQIVYTGNAYPGYGSLGLICKLDLNTNTEATKNIRTLPGATSDDNVVGLAVDPDTGLLYITTGNQGSGGSDRLLSFDSSLNLLYSAGNIGNGPTGLCIPKEEVSYNPLGLSKSDDPDPVMAGGTLTYTISFDNTLNTFPVHNVVLNDTLPVQTVFVSASNGGVYDLATHRVTWNIGTLAAGAPTQSETLVATVKPNTTPGTVIDNSANIKSDETPQTTQHAFTTVVKATIDSSDSVGTKKDTFNLVDNVYANGSGYAVSSTYDIYVVPDTTWVDGMSIPARVPGTTATVTSDSSGKVNPTLLWNAPLTGGKFDIVVDVNNNGKYDAGIDALDNNDVVTTAGFLVIPEFWLGPILGLAGCFAALGVFRISKRQRKLN